MSPRSSPSSQGGTKTGLERAAEIEPSLSKEVAFLSNPKSFTYCLGAAHSPTTVCFHFLLNIEFDSLDVSTLFLQQPIGHSTTENSHSSTIHKEDGYSIKTNSNI